MNDYIKQLLDFLKREIRGNIYTNELSPSFLAGLKIHLGCVEASEHENKNSN